jgi:hypothetical protein
MIRGSDQSGSFYLYPGTKRAYYKIGDKKGRKKAKQFVISVATEIANKKGKIFKKRDTRKKASLENGSVEDTLGNTQVLMKEKLFLSPFIGRNYPCKKTRNYLERYGNSNIIGMAICEVRDRLYLLIELKTPSDIRTCVIERNQEGVLVRTAKKKDFDIRKGKYINISSEEALSSSLNEMLNKMNKIDPIIWIFDHVRHNNKQFISLFLTINKIITEDIIKFIGKYRTVLI